MAKKSGIRSYYSGASAGLIQGAGRAQGPIPVDVQSMFQGMSQAAAANRAQKEYTRRQTEAKAATYLGAMESMDTGVVPETYRGGVEQVLTNFKNQYFETAMALKDTKPDHPDYLNLKDKLNTINNSIKKVAGTFSDMAKNRKEDLEFISNRDYSAGNNAEKVDFINNVLTGSANMFIDEFGNVKFDNNGNWTSYDNLPNVAAYDAKSFNSILTTLDGASRLNRSLTDSDRTLYKAKLMNIIKSGGRDTAISLGSDDFLVDGGMGLGGEAEYDANPEAYKQQLIDSYMNLFENAANDSAQRYQAKLEQQRGNGGSSGLSGYAKNTQADIDNAKSAWNKASVALDAATAAIEAGNPEKADDILKEHEAGFNFEFYASEDKYQGRQGKGSYYVKPFIDSESGQAMIMYKKGSKGEWQYISKADFDKEMAGEAAVGSKTLEQDNSSDSSTTIDTSVY